jgi:nucleoid-associated protein YgaU
MTRSRLDRRLLDRRRPPNRLRAVTARGLLVLAVIAVVAAISWLWHLGGPLEHPPVSASRWPQWWSSREPLDAIAALASVVAVVALGWLGLVACVHLLATWWGIGRLHSLTARLLPGVLRTLVATAALGAGSLHTTGAGAAPAPPLDDTPPTMEVLSPPAGEAGDGAVRVDPAPPPVTTGADGATVGVVRVHQGDHLWGIAAARVRLSLGAEPAPEQIRPYWTALIEANRDRLLDPDDPDLLMPGQELVLPG